MVIDTVLDSLIRAFQSGRLAHGLIFSGVGPAGQRDAALRLAAFILCEQKSACGQCGSCLRLKNGQHESVLMVSSENKVIKIEAVRDIVRDLSLSEWHGPRIVVVERAEEMNAQAANAALKVLEEPPPETYFFLISYDLGSCLSTIRSRCQVVRLPYVQATSTDTLSDEEREWRSLSQKWWSDLQSGVDVAKSDDWRDLVKNRETALELIAIWEQQLQQLRRTGQGPRADFAWRRLLNLRDEVLGQVDRSMAFECYFREVSEGWR